MHSKMFDNAYDNSEELLFHVSILMINLKGKFTQKFTPIFFIILKDLQKIWNLKKNGGQKLS